MDRLTKRTADGVAYMAIAETLSKDEQVIEGSKPILEGLYAMFQKLAAYEDAEEAGLLIKLPVVLGQIVWMKFPEKRCTQLILIFQCWGNGVTQYLPLAKKQKKGGVEHKRKRYPGTPRRILQQTA